MGPKHRASGAAWGVRPRKFHLASRAAAVKCWWDLSLLQIGQLRVRGNINGTTLMLIIVTAWSEFENMARATRSLRASGAKSVVGDLREAIYMAPGGMPSTTPSVRWLTPCCGQIASLRMRSATARLCNRRRTRILCDRIHNFGCLLLEQALARSLRGLGGALVLGQLL
jgi:hypothetical protein